MTNRSKRLLIFLLVGPAIGELIALWLVLYWDKPLELRPRALLGAIGIYPAVLLFAALPALLVAILDDILLERLRGPMRAAACAAAGYAVAYAPAFVAFFHEAQGAAFTFALGLAGAIPGAACSLLAGRRDT